MAGIIRRKGFVTNIARHQGRILGGMAHTRLRKSLSIFKVAAMAKQNTVVAKLVNNVLKKAQASKIGVSVASKIRRSKLFKKFGFLLKGKKLVVTPENVGDVIKRVNRFLAKRRSMKTTISEIPSKRRPALRKKPRVLPEEERGISGFEKVMRKKEEYI